MRLAKVNKIEAHPPSLPWELLSRDFSIPNSGQRRKAEDRKGGWRGRGRRRERRSKGKRKKRGKCPFHSFAAAKQRHTKEGHG